MISAACHPLYSMLADSEVRPRRMFTVTGRCFRHEPAADPMRMQAFRMREYVAVGTESEVAELADRWSDALPQMFTELGLDVTTELANDPFFGRTRLMLAAMQRTLEQKVEFVNQVHPGQDPTAIASVNRPGTHFGDLFAITADGQPAHTVCVAFGIERIAVALLAHKGFEGGRIRD
ncbi:aminoacyl--tRNA ligase-related protein [Gordonia sp. CPCC 205515]|uniref:aminoacyl--tRNA ligase-related protein n=1 Tax=Gordonia sp. CPCC 205515 TaxID=3140791 RepID=UPI003AF364FC